MVIGTLEPQDEASPGTGCKCTRSTYCPRWFWRVTSIRWARALQYAYLTVLGASLVMVLVMLAQG